MAEEGLRPGLSAYWGSIQGAAEQRLGAAGAWEAVRAAATAQGFPLPRGGIQEMNRLYSLAVGVRNASENLNDAGADAALTADHIARTIYSRELQDMNLSPNYHIRFVARTESAGVEETQQLTYTRPGILPATKQDLLDELFAAAQTFTDTLTGVVLDISDLEISAV